MSLTRIKPTAINQSDEFNLANLTVAGNVTATSFIGDGSQLTGISSGGGVTSYNDLTDKPTIPTDINQLTDTNNLLSGGVTSYNDLTDKPTIPNDLTDLGITDGSAGQVLSTDGQGNFSFSTISSGSAGDSTTYYVKRSTNTSISYPGSYTPATIDYEDAGDNYGSADSMWSSATKRFTPTVPGLWYFRASIDCYPGASSEGGINITKNGTVVAQVSDIGAIRMEVTAHVDMNGSTDYVQFAGYTQGVTTRAQTSTMSWFEARLVSGTVSNLADLSVTTNAAGVSALSYNDVTGTFTYTPPDLSGYSTFSGSYTDLTSKPTIPTDINQLTDTNNLLSGGVTSYNDLTDTPTIPTDISQLSDATSLLHPTVSYNDLTDTPTIPSDISQLTDSTNLLNPTISYNDLTDTPTIPSDVNQLTDIDNLLSSGGVTSYNDLTDTPTIPSDISQLTDSTNLLNPTISYNDLIDTPTIPSITGLASETYVNTQISTLVDTAPETLNTLNELAAALSNDPAFATTVTTSIGLKANTADLSSVAFSGSYTDLTSKPSIPTDINQLTDSTNLLNPTIDYADLTGKPTIPTDINDLTDVDNLLGGSGSSEYISNSATSVTTFADSVVIDVDGVSNVVDITPSDITINVPLITGDGGGGNIIGANVISANFFIGNGALLTGLSGSGIYTDGDVALFLPQYTGNITANNITSNYFIGNGSLLTGLPAGYTDSDANTAIDTRVTKTFIDNLNVDADTLDGHDTSYFATSTQGGLADTAVQPGDNISELTNDAGYLVTANLSGYATETYVDTAVSTLVNSSPAMLDTLGELANALGNDANYSTTITNALADKLSTSDFTNTANVWLSTKSTTDISEGDNLYYTTARANTAIDNRVTKLFVDNLSIVADTVLSSSQPNITSLGTLTSLTVTGTLTATAGVKTANISDTTGTITIKTKYNDSIGDVGILGNLTVGTGGTGNITATYFIGNGSQLTGLPSEYTDSNVASYLPTYDGDLNPGNISISVDNLEVLGGSSGQALITDGLGGLSWSSMPLGTLISNGSSNVKISSPNGIVTTSVNGVTDVTTITSTGVVIDGSLAVSGITTLQQSTEVVSQPSGSTYDFNTGAIFFTTASSLGSNFTPNFTNIPTTGDRIIVVAIIIDQNAGPYMPTATANIQIDGTNYQVRWPNGTAPIGQASSLQVVSYNLLRTNDTWIVSGSGSSYY